MINKNILFVCLGNICRSPAAEGVMKSLVEKENLARTILVDSAGTINYHEGERADARMRRHAARRGYDLTSISRMFNPEKDFDKFDYIVTMDDNNYRDISALDKSKKYAGKIFKMASFANGMNVKEVPDPYYEGDEGFEHVLDILEQATQGLLNKVKDDIKQQHKEED